MYIIYLNKVGLVSKKTKKIQYWKFIEKFNKFKTIDKISTIFWFIWIISVLAFIVLVIAIPHPDIKVNHDGAILYANILAASAIVVVVLLFTALSLTIFPKAKWKNTKSGNQ